MKLIINTVDKKKHIVTPEFPGTVSVESQVNSVLTNFRSTGLIKTNTGLLITFSSVLSIEVEK